MTLPIPPIGTEVLQPDGAQGRSNFTVIWYRWLSSLVDAIKAAGGGGASSTNGSFTGTLTGFVANPTGTVRWAKVGSIVILDLSGLAVNGTSNATTMTMTGLPAALKPANTQPYDYLYSGSAYDNSAAAQSAFQMDNAGIMQFYTVSAGGIIGGWTAANVKGFRNQKSYTYSVL
jgi:hypothetical protein